MPPDDIVSSLLDLIMSVASRASAKQVDVSALIDAMQEADRKEKLRKQNYARDQAALKARRAASRRRVIARTRAAVAAKRVDLGGFTVSERKFKEQQRKAKDVQAYRAELQAKMQWRDGKYPLHSVVVVLICFPLTCPMNEQHWHCNVNMVVMVLFGHVYSYACERSGRKAERCNSFPRRRWQCRV